MSVAAVTVRPEVGGEVAPRAGIVRGGIGIALATAVASAANYASNVVLGRGLEDRQFADAALVVSGLLLLSAVALGLQLTVARGVAAGGGRLAAERVQRRAVLVGGIVAAAVAATSPAIAGAFNMESAVPVAVLALGVPIFFSMAVRRGVLQATHHFGRLALSQFVEPMVRLAVTIVALAAGLGATSAAVGLVVSFAVGWWVSSPRHVLLDTTPIGAGTATRSAIGATVLLLAGQVVIANGDLWVVAALRPDDAGSYAAVALIGRLVFITAWSIVTVVFPSLVSGTAEASDVLLLRAVGATAVVGAMLTAGAAVAGDRLVVGMVGSDYADVAHLLWPYALATSLFVMANLVAVADVAAGRRALPGVVTIGAGVQTAALVAVAGRGIAWVIWGQVVVMASLFVVVASIALVRASRCDVACDAR
jgi:O-antigen/teichoic acid export membrane protein